MGRSWPGSREAVERARGREEKDRKGGATRREKITVTWPNSSHSTRVGRLGRTWLVDSLSRARPLASSLARSPVFIALARRAPVCAERLPSSQRTLDSLSRIRCVNFGDRLACRPDSLGVYSLSIPKMSRHSYHQRDFPLK